MTNAEARFNKSLRPRKPEGSLGRTAHDVHLDSQSPSSPISIPPSPFSPSLISLMVSVDVKHRVYLLAYSPPPHPPSLCKARILCNVPQGHWECSLQKLSIILEVVEVICAALTSVGFFMYLFVSTSRVGGRVVYVCVWGGGAERGSELLVGERVVRGMEGG